MCPVNIFLHKDLVLDWKSHMQHMVDSELRVKYNFKNEEESRARV